MMRQEYQTKFTNRKNIIISSEAKTLLEPETLDDFDNTCEISNNEDNLLLSIHLL